MKSSSKITGHLFCAVEQDKHWIVSSPFKITLLQEYEHIK